MHNCYGMAVKSLRRKWAYEIENYITNHLDLYVYILCVCVSQKKKKKQLKSSNVGEVGSVGEDIIIWIPLLFYKDEPKLPGRLYVLVKFFIATFYCGLWKFKFLSWKVYCEEK